ncbi:synviolin family ubiquitin-protein ligase Hrd1 [Schizosaccharomyces octosporus yFS286]|uniref:RING-type E3 ubiquitin transferase n=1 Tax=Schizosaccharomyces octosporus (strain yFS286) TaxID=483514 RepID=S9PT66_SCHOY|nr:synviolin family ubiquitin-protein ligase Hrd1 [Schizosaccharomyces octosporus yFS286]EPX72346.1 synviolin family ubiquitin-protein ligase Hrd1 [Schizosaccharomyces octosporus yFS286]
MKFILYVLASILLFGLSVLLSLYSSANVYAAAVMISQSPIHITIGLNVCLCIFFAIANALKALLFGSLQTFELELLYEQFWITLTEAMISITTLRDPISISFFLLLSALMFARVFHSICAFRTERQQVQLTDRQFNIFNRLTCALLILAVLDITFVYLCSNEYFGDISTRILFICEFSVLFVNIVTEAIKLGLYVYETRHPEQVWQEKSIYLFRLEVVRDALRLLAYSILLLFQHSYVSFPLYAIRHLYISFYSLFRRLREHARYRQATRDMEAMYPSATEEQLSNSDRTCTICREEMFHPDFPPENIEEMEPLPRGLDMTPKRLPCGHILHLHCLRNWLQRQQTCPICRRPVFGEHASSPANTAVNPFPVPTPTAVENANQNIPRTFSPNVGPRNANLQPTHTIRPGTTPPSWGQFQNLNGTIPLRNGWSMLPIPGVQNIPANNTTNMSADTNAEGQSVADPNVDGIIPPGWRLISRNSYPVAPSLQQQVPSLGGSSMPLPNVDLQMRPPLHTAPVEMQRFSSLEANSIQSLHQKIDEMRGMTERLHYDMQELRSSVRNLGVLVNESAVSEGFRELDQDRRSTLSNSVVREQFSQRPSALSSSLMSETSTHRNPRNVQLETLDEDL